MNNAFLPLVDLSPDRRQAAENGLLVTGSDRLRREFIYAYDHARMLEGQTAWNQPAICGFEALLRENYDRERGANPHCPKLLSPIDTHQLVRATAPEGLAHLSRTFEDAWGLVQAWNIDIEAPAFEATENSRCFAAWAQRLQLALTSNNAITPAELGNASIPVAIPASLMRSDPRSSKPHLRLTGFDVVSPKQMDFLDQLKALGVHVHIEEPNPAKATGQETEKHQSVAAYPSNPAELTAAICWARAQLEAADPEAAPPRIGIVVPDLLAQHARVSRLLHAHLESTDSRLETLYNIGGGLPLATHPLVESAMDLLRCIHRPTRYNQLQRLLADPALPAISTRTPLSSQCAEFMQLSELPQDAGPEPMRVILRQIASWAGPGSTTQPVADWWVAAASVLRNTRWHTARNDSEGYQVTNALLELLISGAPRDLQKVSWENAFDLLESVAQQTLFAPASAPAPIQVLGYLEANELQFDALWITGMDANSWPTPVSNNPLLPPEELLRVGVPRTTHSAELGFAQRWLERVSNFPTHCRASFVSEDLPDAATPESTQRLSGLSPLLRHWNVTAQIETPAFHPLVEHWQDKTIELELRDDFNGPGAAPGRLHRATRRLENQAACPMRGWSLHTLDLEEPIPPHSLPNPMERGILLHNTLQKLYQKISSASDLQALDLQAREALCKTLAQRGTDQELHRFSTRIRDLEAQRLSTALIGFLTLESKRNQFNVAALEQEITGKLGPWNVHLKVDRIDDQPEGQIVIDYKSSSPAIGKLQDERLSAPQIPLYVLFILANGKPINALEFSDPLVQGGAFAEIKPDSARYVGVRETTAESLAALKLDHKTLWPETLRRWCNQLTSLGEELEQGYALARPTKDICSRCHLHRLCRYHLNNE